MKSASWEVPHYETGPGEARTKWSFTWEKCRWQLLTDKMALE